MCILLLSIEVGVSAVIKECYTLFLWSALYIYTDLRVFRQIGMTMSTIFSSKTKRNLKNRTPTWVTPITFDIYIAYNLVDQTFVCSFVLLMLLLERDCRCSSVSQQQTATSIPRSNLASPYTSEDLESIINLNFGCICFSFLKVILFSS